MTSPIFDQRTAATYFKNAVELARLYCPQWGLPDGLVTADDIALDPGLALLKLFSLLGQDLANILNAIPQQRQLALYRFLDMGLRSASCASGPISFFLAPKHVPVLLPKGTQVVDSSSERLSFETNNDLQVLPARLSAALTVAPGLDSYLDVQALWANGKPAPFLPGPPINGPERRFAHALLLGDADLFAPSCAERGMTIELHGQNLDCNYFRNWRDGVMSPLFPQVSCSLDATSCTIHFPADAMPAGQPQTIAALHAFISAAAGRQLDPTDPSVTNYSSTPLYWLFSEPVCDLRVVPALNGHLPLIDTIWCTLGAIKTLPQQAAANGIPIDLRNGAYAFGQNPGQDATFGIRCDAALARPSVPVKMTFILRSLTNNPTATIAWQYWDGMEWSAFSPKDDPDNSNLKGDPYRFVDNTENLTTGGTISFTCPEMQQISIAGSRGYWIRAAITSGDYSDKGGSALPPFVHSLVIEYEGGGVPSSVWSHNAFSLNELKRTPYEPYRPLSDESVCVYLAFEAPDLIAYGLGQRLTLYADVDPIDEHIGYADAGEWQWFDAMSSTWKPLAIDMGEAGLARSGEISFTVPAQLQPSAFFSKTACWFRIVCPQRKHALRLRGLYPNTVSACNRSTYRNVTTGSSNGQPGQRFVLTRLSTTPTGKDQVLLAVSSDPQYAVQVQVIEPAISESISTDAAQAQPTAPYSWTRVDSFVGHGPQERVFVIDFIAGAIVFGDAVQGRIPPPGSNNIIATCYATTRGDGGNVAAGELTTLYSAVSGITKVTNPIPVRGGADADCVEDLIDIAPALVRANDRVVSAADAEALACMANAGVSRVRAIEQAAPSVLDDAAGVPKFLPRFPRGGRTLLFARQWPRLELVVLAKSADPEPLTPMWMLDDVLEYVRARSMPSLAARTTARRPSFKRVDAAVLLQTNAPKSQWATLRRDCAGRLARFLHPALGAAAGKGWPIGEPLRYMAVHAFLLGVDVSVTSVMALALCGQTNDVSLEPHEAPSAGTIDIRLAEAPQS